MNMFRWGLLILLLGLAALFLPMFGVQLRILSMFGSNAQAAGIGVVVIGGVLIFLGMRHDN
jgi:hypothetical protein